MKKIIFISCLVLSTILCINLNIQKVYAITESGDSNGGNLDSEGELKPEKIPDGAGNGSSSGGGSSGGASGGSGSGNNIEQTKTAYDAGSLQCSSFGYTMLYSDSPITVSYSGIGATTEMQSHVQAKLVSARNQAYNMRSGLGGNHSKMVCVDGPIRVNMNITEHEDTTRAPNSWKYNWKYASQTGFKQPYYNENNLIFDTDYTHFYSYSDGMIEEMIDAGYFDYLLDSNSDIKEARKDLNRSELKAWYNERDYQSEVITGHDSWKVNRNIFLNPYYWHQALMYYKLYFYDYAQGLLAIKGIEIDYEEKTYSSNPGVSAKEHSQYVSGGYWWNYDKKKTCVNANNGTTNGSDVGSCTWIPAKYKTWWTRDEYTANVKTMDMIGVTNYEPTTKTTDWKFYDKWIGYIEPTGKTSSGDPTPENPKPHPELEKACPLVFPNAINKKSCRNFERDGTVEKGSTNAEMTRYCKCLPISNLTD